MRNLFKRSRGVAARAVLVGSLVFVPTLSAHADTWARKAGRGAAAITCGFLEIPGNMVKTTQEQGPIYGFSLGFAKGLGAMLVREMVGVYELLSAPVPAPKDFRPILKPEFPWDYFE